MKKFWKTIISFIFAAILTTGVVFHQSDVKESNIEVEEVVEVIAPPIKIPEVTLVAVGDVMLSRKVDKLIKEKGIEYPFAQTNQLLASADITFGNLESPLSTKGKKLPGKGIWFRGNPQNVQALTVAGFDIFSLANNHALDYDSPALLETIEVLSGGKIDVVGGGVNIDQACSPVITEVDSIKLGFLAYSEMADMFWSYEYPRRLKATSEIPGIAPLYTEKILEDVAAIREQVDYVVVSLHWGVEYQHHPENYQKEIAHQLIDGGVDLILGHHPHCVQGIEVYKNGIIAYSLGNFVFDQNWSEQTKQGLLLKLRLTHDAWESVEILPIYIDNSQPIVAQGDVGNSLLNLAIDISEGLGTEFEIIDGKGIIKLPKKEPEYILQVTMDN